MNYRKALLLIIVVVALSFCANSAFAQCACAPTYKNKSARDEFKLAFAVFVGKVVNITKTARDRNDSYVQTVTFKVTRVWKRDLEANLTITNTILGCVNGFDENEEWLVYVYRHRDGTFVTYCCCSRTKPLAKSAEDLKTFADDPPGKGS